ncbi:MAG: hypothetical protein Q4D53_00195 [Leptotrichiaceae bacterium]|nr:hypothetical protein [Leptotrichiaceae bacterium]
MKKLSVILTIALLIISCEEKQSKTVIKGLEQIYGNKSNTIEKLCYDKYEIFYAYHKGKDRYYKEIVLNKTSSDLWTGTVESTVNNKMSKEEKIYYKNGKYYDSKNNKERKDLDDIKPYFQNDVFTYDEFEVTEEVSGEDIMSLPSTPSLYAKYKDKQSFNDYFTKAGADIKFKNANPTVYAKYSDGKKKPKFFEIRLRRKNEGLGESCLLKDE